MGNRKTRIWIYFVLVLLVGLSRNVVHNEYYQIITYYGIFIFIYYVVFLDEKLSLHLKDKVFKNKNQ